MSALSRDFYEGYHVAITREHKRLVDELVHRIVLERRLSILERQWAVLDQMSFFERLPWVISGRLPLDARR